MDVFKDESTEGYRVEKTGGLLRGFGESGQAFICILLLKALGIR